jgi:hypothetical protein
MLLSNVIIGSGPGANNGESIYSAFNKVNQNFANVQSNVNSLSNSVTSVAGRTGNILLTINDIIGFNGLSLVSSSAPASSTSTGIKGQVIVSGSYMYVCTATNVWVRSSVTTSF